jgi:tetratricopeptide (TPR) repeat protein
MGAAHLRLSVLAALLLATGCAARRLMREGDAYLEAGRVTLAARCYRQACEHRPENGELQLRLARAYLADAEPLQAEAPARKALALAEPGADLTLAEALIRTGRSDDAAPLLDAAGSRDPGDPALLELHALLLLAHHDPAATATMRRAVELAPSPRREAVLAWLLARAGSMEDAAAAAHRVLEAGAEDPDALGDAGAALLLAGDEAGARTAAREVQSCVADIADRWQDQATHAQQAGDVEGALRLAARVAALHPQDGVQLGRLGLMFTELGDRTLASRFLEAALASGAYRASWEHAQTSQEGGTVATMGFQDDEAAGLAAALADTRVAQGRVREGAQALRAALIMGGSPTAAGWTKAAAMFEQARDWQASVEAAQEAIRLDPTTMEPLLILTRIHGGSGDLDQVIGYARMAWRLAPGEPRVALLLGEMYELRGEPAAARELYLEALRLDPGIAPLRAALQRVER